MQAKAKVLLPVSVEEALELTAAALQDFYRGGEVQVDRVYLSAAMELPSTWRSSGEHLVATVDAAEGGSVVEVSSRGTRPVLIDYGKNRKNVEAICERLRVAPLLD